MVKRGRYVYKTSTFDGYCSCCGQPIPFATESAFSKTGVQLPGLMCRRCVLPPPSSGFRLTWRQRLKKAEMAIEQ